MKDFIAVRTKYYKKQKARHLENHIRRDKKNKNTATVRKEYSDNNFYHTIRSVESCEDEYRELNGRGTRKDFNQVFEHMLIFSEEQYSALEEKHKDPVKVKKALAKLIKNYGEEIKEKYGFEPLELAIHLDEGHDNEKGDFVRNVHCHFTFYNYDFKKKFAPLKNIQKKIRDAEGKWSVNPCFSDFQDIAGKVFKRAGFKRGQKKSFTNAEHKDRDAFIVHKQNNALTRLTNAFNAIKKDIPEWIKNLNLPGVFAEIKSRSIAKNIDDIEMDSPGAENEIDSVVEYVEEHFKPPEPQKVSPKRQRRRRKKPD